MQPGSDNRYSRFIVWAKIILPLIGLAILSSLFLFSQSKKPGSVPGLSIDETKTFADKEHITGPRFAGMTPSGIAIQLSASEASPRPGETGAFDASDLKANIAFPDGKQLNITAKTGRVNANDQMAELVGGILLQTSTGYVAKTAGIRIALDRLDVRSLGPITASGSFGNISAGQMVLTMQPSEVKGASPGYVLVFNNHVKLLYQP